MTHHKMMSDQTDADDGPDEQTLRMLRMLRSLDNAQEHLSDGLSPEDAAERAGVPVEVTHQMVQGARERLADLRERRVEAEQDLERLQMEIRDERTRLELINDKIHELEAMAGEDADE